MRAARRRIIEAADAARAQLTRDLHDGAQQRFVISILDLQLAERKAPSEPEAAARLREAALDQARAGVAELRDLAAGIHPGILTERGLGPAVEALAARLPISVAVVQTPDRRLATAVEASVYFFVSEALTNVSSTLAPAEHGSASASRTVVCSSRSATTGSVGRRRRTTAPAWRGSATGSRHWTAS